MSTASLNESFGEQRLLDIYLRGTKLIKIVEEKADQFIKTYAASKSPEDARAPIIIQLSFQFRDLAERSQTLLELAIDEPEQFLDTIKYLVYSIVASILKESLVFTPKHIDSSQIHIQCQFIGLPVQEDLLLNASENKLPKGLAVLCGILSAYTDPVQYTIQSIWYCSTGCKANRIKGEVTRAPNCLSCTRPMSEYAKLRCMGKYRLLKVFPFESVSTPKVLDKLFQCQVVRLFDYIYEGDLILGAKYIVTGHLDFQTLELIAWNLVRHPGKEAVDDVSQFQHHQPIDVPLHTTDLFPEYEQGNVSNEKTVKYPEFDLDFSLDSVEPSLCLNSQQPVRCEISSDSKSSDRHEESVFVHPQIKDEPLDLSFHFTFPPASAQGKCGDDFNLEFSAFATSSKVCSAEASTSESAEPNGDPYAIGPGCSRNVVAHGEQNHPPTARQEGQSQVDQSCTRVTPMEFLTLSYGKTTISGSASPPANSADELPSSQSTQHVDTTLIPEPVTRLYETIKKAYSDFAFVYSLAAQMCQDRIPMDCFVHLKLGLLLSIASLEENPHRPPISVVAIGPEFGMAHYLMENIGMVAERFVGPHDDFKVPPHKNGEPVWIEAEPVVLARGGVYYVGDWSRLKPPNAFKILKMIETGRVMLQRTSVWCPLETAVWTHWRSYKYDTKDQHTFNKLIEIFGIPLVIEEDNHEVLVDYILEQASEQVFESTIDELSIGTDDIRQFLAIVSKRRVDLTDEASDILRKYFVASRMDRPDCLSQQSFSCLKLFAESFAKLSLRHDVIAADAVAACYMTENFIQSLFGAGAFPPPKFESHSYIGAVDEHLDQFKEWLNTYISQFHENN